MYTRMQWPAGNLLYWTSHFFLFGLLTFKKESLNYDLFYWLRHPGVVLVDFSGERNDSPFDRTKTTTPRSWEKGDFSEFHRSPNRIPGAVLCFHRVNLSARAILVSRKPPLAQQSNPITTPPAYSSSWSTACKHLRWRSFYHQEAQWWFPWIRQQRCQSQQVPSCRSSSLLP